MLTMIPTMQRKVMPVSVHSIYSTASSLGPDLLVASPAKGNPHSCLRVLEHALATTGSHQGLARAQLNNNNNNQSINRTS